MSISNALKRKAFPFPFYSLRNISSPEDVQNDRKIYTGHAPLTSILEIPTSANVRSYLADAEGKQRKVYTSVHRAIKETLLIRPEQFSVLNSGVVIVVHDIELDDKSKIVTLNGASIINGSQTQGVLKDLREEGKLPNDIHIKFEIIVTKDDDLVAETSIARNYQNDVMNISIAGRRGQFDELELAFRKLLPNYKLRKSETELPTNETIDTEKLLQIITALIPPELWYRAGEDNNPNKVYTYSMKAKCLKEFQEIFIRAKNSDDDDQKKYEALYKFYLDISADAWLIYTKWKSHQGFKGTRIQNGVTRDSEGNIVDIADGIIFPILSSFSVFAKKTRSGWKISPPDFFSDDELIKTAKTALTEIAFHNPWNMGKSKACYSALLQITSLYKKLESRK
jgi:hypothetical protein